MSFTDCEHQYTDLNAEACCLCGEYKGDALDTYDRPAPVRSQTMAAGFAANYGAGPEVPLAQLSEPGTLCSICKHHGMDIPQVESPSGVTCRFGHGGADAWIPPSEPQPPGPSVPVEELFGQTTVTPEFTTYAVDPLATYTQHELAGVPQAQPTVHHIEYGHSQLEVRMAAQMDARASLPVFAETPPTAFDYAYDYRSAHCNDCTLKPTTDNHCAGRAPRAPENFNGLMIVWGYPTHRAIRMGDASGGERSTLQQRLKAHGIEYDACYVTHAIACNVPYEMQKSDIPANVFDSCRYKLLTEVQNIQPRVILAFGSTAFTALMGDQVMKERREAYDCPTCSNERKWRLWGCIKCKTDFKHLPWTDAKVTPEGSPWDHFCACVKEDGSHTKGPKGKDVKPPKWQKHVIECSDCGGLKTKAVQLPTFSCAYNLTGKGGMAGGAFTIDRTPMGHLYPESVRQNTYLLGTYDPHQLHNKAATQAQKGVVGQFLLPSFDAHIGKVSRLLSGKKPHWDLNWSSTKDPYELRQFMNQALVTCGREEGKPGAENGLGGPQDHGVRRDHAARVRVAAQRVLTVREVTIGRLHQLDVAGLERAAEQDDALLLGGVGAHHDVVRAVQQLEHVGELGPVALTQRGHDRVADQRVVGRLAQPVHVHVRHDGRVGVQQVDQGDGAGLGLATPSAAAARGDRGDQEGEREQRERSKAR